MRKITYVSPLGPIRLRADDTALLELTFADEAGAPASASGHPVLAAACDQLDEYFAGERREFSLPVRLAGTAWERRVWDALMAIPYATTVTYDASISVNGAVVYSHPAVEHYYLTRWRKTFPFGSAPW